MNQSRLIADPFEARFATAEQQNALSESPPEVHESADADLGASEVVVIGHGKRRQADIDIGAVKRREHL